MHKLLERQLRRHVDSASIDALPEPWQRFVTAVEAAYVQADNDRVLLERSIDLVSHELVEHNQALVRSNAELQQFAYVASHDLQEPLRMVTAYMQLLSRRYKDKLDTDAQEFIGFAVDGVQRMQRLINDLLTYSRVETRQRALESVDLAEVLRQATSNLQIAIAESQAVITHDPLPTVLGDAAQLVQVLQNLLGNAIKFRVAGRPPHIHLGIESRGAEWVVTVKDNGIGIDPSYADRIFVIFQRLHTAAEYPGTGIGLAICKKIVERHGGRIWVESQPGQGAAFRLTLPSVPRGA
jgi:light-regulated signal transduction histidine kinase (bacteriophytochrome)